MNEEERHAARMVLGHLGHPEGYKGGSFTEALLTAWDLADRSNADRLGQAFPVFIAPIAVARKSGADTLADLLRT